MEVWKWLSGNWFVFLQSVGIVGSLIFTAVSLRSETKTRRVANLLVITESHRQIWTLLLKHPGLSRILDPSVDLRRAPVTLREDLFVRLLILHMSSSFRAMKDDVFLRPDGLARDIAQFLSLPVPQKVWDDLKPLQDSDFVCFVEGCTRSEARE